MRLNYIISYHSYEFDAVSVKLTEYLQVIGEQSHTGE